MEDLKYWLEQKADIEQSIANLDGVGLTNNVGYTTYDMLTDYLDYAEEQIAKLQEGT